MNNNSENKKVVTRFAPSPTGALHIGGYRTAIFSYLHAKHTGGEFILRIEDTDKERNKPEHEKDIIDTLEWIGLAHDRFYRQSEHIERHKKVIEQFIDGGFAYISNEEAKDGSGVMKEIIRFKNPNKVITFTDIIKGEVSIDTTDLGDFVIARGPSDPLFHFAVVVDDHDEGVTHVIRGDDHLSNTPRQILMYEALGAKHPEYAHLPLVLGPDKLKLSKRRGARPLSDYRELGYLPEALLNTAVLIGWNPGGEEEIFIKDQLVEIFDVTRVQKGSAAFNEEKLQWVNKEHMKRLSDEEKLTYAKRFLTSEFVSALDDAKFARAMPVFFERISHGAELRDMETSGVLAYMTQTPTLDPKILTQKTDSEKTREYLNAIKEIIEKNDFTSIENIKTAVMAYVDTLESRGAALHPMRYALSGLEKSPDPFTISFILGRDEALTRLESAIGLLA